MAHTLSDQSLQSLARVLHDARPDSPDTPDAKTCEDLGRMILSMYRNMAHPVRMFRLISQVSDSPNPDVEALTPLAWALAEAGPQLLVIDDDDGLDIN